MLGSTLKEYFLSNKFKIETLDRIELDLSTCGVLELEESVTKKECDILINCAGLIKQRKNVTTSDFVAVNSLLPHRLSGVCKKQNIKMIHITTDCVFSGKEGGYDEDSMHDVFDDYGKSKSMGEPKDCTVIRTSIIGEEKNNNLSLLEWVKSNRGGNISGFKNHIWNGVTCLQLGKIINNIIKDDYFWKGVRHVFSPELNKHQLVSIINEIYDLNIIIKPENASTSIDRTLSTKFNSINLEENNYHVNLIKKIPNLYKQIEETKAFHDDIRHKAYLEHYDKLL